MGMRIFPSEGKNLRYLPVLIDKGLGRFHVALVDLGLFYFGTLPLRYVLSCSMRLTYDIITTLIPHHAVKYPWSGSTPRLHICI